MNKPNLCIDIDGTLCSNTNGSYEDAEPFEDAVRAVIATKLPDIKSYYLRLADQPLGSTGGS